MKKRFGLFGPQQIPPTMSPIVGLLISRRSTESRQGRSRALRRARLEPLSSLESVERDDQLTMMEAMANPQKTAAIYFAMAEAMSAVDERPLSDRDLAEAEDSVEHLNRRP
jgi:hypothetical protein